MLWQIVISYLNTVKTIYKTCYTDRNGRSFLKEEWVWGRISSYGDVGMRSTKWSGVFILGFSRFIFEKYT